MVKIDLFGGDSLAKVLHYYNYPSDEEKIVCPFHDDIMPSMQVNYEAGTCFCYGCQKSYYPIDFVKKFEHITDDLQSCLKLSHIMNSDKVSHIKVQSHVKKRCDSKQMLIEAEDFYFNLKSVDWRSEHSDELEYMKKRGFSCKTLNMCHAKYTYNSAYPIVFPMYDNGTFKGWVCRTIHKSIERRRKYLYNEGFSRSTTLCGHYSKNKPVVVCEGYMDMLKFRQFGINNVVAILGWKATSEQISKLKSFGITTVISGLDSDECGRKGTAYLKNFFKVIEFQYPAGVKDAGEMTQEQFDVSFKKTKRLFSKNKNSGGN